MHTLHGPLWRLRFWLLLAAAFLPLATGRARANRPAALRRVPASPPLDERPHSFLFVSGVHFSGTSVVHYSLAAHPDVSTFAGVGRAVQDEGQQFQDVLSTATQLGKACLEAAAPGLSARLHEAGRYFALCNASRADAGPQAFGTARFAALRSQWGPLWDTTKRVLVQKSPPDLIRMPFLNAAFPPASFIVTLRHPLSVCRRVGANDATVLCVRNWVAAYEWALRDTAAFNLSVSFIFYEDFVRDPAAELKRAGAAAGIGDNFDWAASLDAGPNVDVGLDAHRLRGWGYARPKGSKSTEPVLRGRSVVERVAVDGSRPLPHASQDIGLMEPGSPTRTALEGMAHAIGAFGYLWHPPWVDPECGAVRRRGGACGGAGG